MTQTADMRSELFRRLRAVRLRLRARQVMIRVERVLPLAALAGIGLATTGLVAGVAPAGVTTAVVLSLLLVAMFWGMTRPIDWTLAARAVDDRYALADRTLSALANVREHGNVEISPLAELQVRDALRCLEPAVASDVVTLRPAGRSMALLVVLVLFLAIDWGTAVPQTAGAPRLPAPDASPRLNNLPAATLTQPRRVGLPGGPLALQERKEDSYLGDNAAVGRYFELLERPAASAQQPR